MVIMYGSAVNEIVSASVLWNKVINAEKISWHLLFFPLNTDMQYYTQHMARHTCKIMSITVDLIKLIYE